MIEIERPLAFSRLSLKDVHARLQASKNENASAILHIPRDSPIVAWRYKDEG